MNTEPAPTSVRVPLHVDREIGRLAGDREGATLIAVAAIHGNEQAGIHAARRVLSRLSQGVHVRGELLVLAGNVGAMREGRRYVLRDLNRVWSDENVAAIEGRPASALDAEEREQLELLSAIRAAIARARGPVFLVDLHTTSAAGVPFVLFGDTLAQRAFAGEMPLPVVLGLEEQLDGVLSGYWTRHGITTFAVEGGQHRDPGSVDNLESVLLLAAERAGIFARAAIRETADARALLERRRADLPRVLEVIRRHAITPEDEFVMEAGFRNLDFARSSRLLARDRHGEIRAPHDGMVILPLYQGLGADGFFWGRAVGPARLRASKALRELRAERLLPMLPGVRRDASAPSRLLVDRSTARILPRTVFHLLGYRRMRERDGVLTVERQPG